MTQVTAKLPPVTKWFDGKTTVPGQPGVYERKHINGRRFAHWDGTHWGIWSELPTEALEWATKPSCIQDHAWRGLTEEVK